MRNPLPTWGRRSGVTCPCTGLIAGKNVHLWGLRSIKVGQPLPIAPLRQQQRRLCATGTTEDKDRTDFDRNSIHLLVSGLRSGLGERMARQHCGCAFGRWPLCLRSVFPHLCRAAFMFSIIPRQSRCAVTIDVALHTTSAPLNREIAKGKSNAAAEREQEENSNSA